MYDRNEGLVIDSSQSLAEGFRRRIALSGLSFAYVLLAVPTLALLILVSVSLSISVIGIGLIFLVALVPLNAKLADVHRNLSGYILDSPIDRPYRRNDATSTFAMLRFWAADPARWRDFGWTWANVSVGWALSWIGFGLLLAPLFYAIYPFLFWVTPDGVFATNYGIFQVDSQAKSFFEWTFAVITFFIWWKLEPVIVHARAKLDRSLLAPSRDELERRVQQVSQSRTETIDHSAAELRRIERDLHDGAQARLVALGMTLGMAEQIVTADPDEAVRLLSEARSSTTTVLGELRSVVRGIHPPVLADRGLAGAVQALALDMAIPVTVVVTLPGRPPAPVESAVYFAVAEFLANIGKHAGASRVSITVSHTDGSLSVIVADDGCGGADEDKGSGIAGVGRRLAAFDGTVDITSPDGAGTVATMEVPCALSSPRTTRSSATD